MNPELDHVITPKRVKARGMGEILSIAEMIKDDKILGERVREIVRRVRAEEEAFKKTNSNPETS